MLDVKLQAIENCRSINMPVILTPTIIRGINDSQLGELIDFAMNNLDVICGLAIQPAFESGRFDMEMKQRLSLGDIANMIEKQTGGRIVARDFWPVGCIHPLCACSTYLLGKADYYVPFTRHIDEDNYRTYFDSGSPQGSVFADILARMYPSVETPIGLPILIMSYMDRWTIDLNRLQECNLAVTVSGGCSIPFCAYHLTAINGQRLYPLGHRRISTIDYPKIQL